MKTYWKVTATDPHGEEVSFMLTLDLVDYEEVKRIALEACAADYLDFKRLEQFR